MGKAALFLMSKLFKTSPLKLNFLFAANGYRKRKMVLFANKSKKITFKIVMSLREKISVLYGLDGYVSERYLVLSIIIIVLRFSWPLNKVTT